MGLSEANDQLKGYYTPLHHRGVHLSQTDWQRGRYPVPPEYFKGRTFVPRVFHPVFEFQSIYEDAIADIKFVKDRCDLSLDLREVSPYKFYIDFGVLSTRGRDSLPYPLPTHRAHCIPVGLAQMSPTPRILAQLCADYIERLYMLMKQCQNLPAPTTRQRPSTVHMLDAIRQGRRMFGSYSDPALDTLYAIVIALSLIHI